jgi:hypothetical protein
MNSLANRLLESIPDPDMPDVADTRSTLSPEEQEALMEALRLEIRNKTRAMRSTSYLTGNGPQDAAAMVALFDNDHLFTALAKIVPDMAHQLRQEHVYRVALEFAETYEELQAAKALKPDDPTVGYPRGGG